jgi:CRISPR-associated protein Cas2
MSRVEHRSSRRRYLIAYDIREPGRLRAIHKVVKAHGEPLQYSVFLCDLNPSELTGVRWKLEDMMAHEVDSILILDLGNPRDLSAFTFLGERATLPISGPRIL